MLNWLILIQGLDQNNQCLSLWKKSAVTRKMEFSGEWRKIHFNSSVQRFQTLKTITQGAQQQTEAMEIETAVYCNAICPMICVTGYYFTLLVCRKRLPKSRDAR